MVLQGKFANAGAGDIHLGSLSMNIVFYECFGCIMYC